MTYTRTRKGSKAHRGPSQAAQDRQAEVELAVTGINDETPDYGAFLARWGSRYGEANLARLWVQCPGATALHRFGTWHGTGRQVRKGEHAIWLRIPHNGFDPDKVTAENPDGRVFAGRRGWRCSTTARPSRQTALTTPRQRMRTLTWWPRLSGSGWQLPGCTRT